MIITLVMILGNTIIKISTLILMARSSEKNFNFALQRIAILPAFHFKSKLT